MGSDSWGSTADLQDSGLNLKVAAPTSHKSKGLCLDGQQKLVLEYGPRWVERNVEARYAGVGGGELVIVRRFNGNRRFGLETLLAGGQGGAGGPEVDL